MSQAKRSEIEKRIQQLSMELEQDLFEQMQQKVEQKLDMKKMDDIVAAFNEAISSFEYTMEEIMKTVRDFDDYEV